MTSRLSRLASIAIGAFSLLALLQLSSAQSELKKDDHIVIIGSGVADRMQHHGWLEAYLQAEFPDLQLTIRNNGFAGDRIDKRPRSAGFMSPDAYLTHCKADVIFAMFGYNESFDATPADFEKTLIKWINETRTRKYNTNSAPRIILFSPIAHENLHDRNLPDGKANNARLGAYTEATKAAAIAGGIGFVDLYSPTLKLYRNTKTPLTINGVHPNSEGCHAIARVIVGALRGAEPRRHRSELKQIRDAVLDKNWHWFNRYRATDGNNIWGSRSKLAFTDGQTNRVVLEQELRQLDVMTANRDKVIWAAVAGNEINPDDSNVPAPIPVKTNLTNLIDPSAKQKNRIGTTDYLSPEESLATMRFAKGLEGNVFASEEMFPSQLVNPVQLGVDPKGRLWAATWPTYPKWDPLKEMNDQLVILPDENRDGVADRAITFAHVHNPTGFEFWNGGVIVASAPDILFLKDTDGDDVADLRVRIVSAIDSADTHHAANNFVYGPDGFIYYQRGGFHISNVETPWTSNQLSDINAMFRFNPRTHEFSFHTGIGGGNLHGIGFDYWGYHYSTAATSGLPFQIKPQGDGRFISRELFRPTVRPIASSGVFSSAQFPERFQNNFLICNTIGFRGIKRYTLDYDTNTGDVKGTETEDLLVTGNPGNNKSNIYEPIDPGKSPHDPNFRPTDFEVGDDGALYVSDWANAIIGHMQHNIRDPGRDHLHGRIIRVVSNEKPLATGTLIDGQSIEVLLAHLESPTNGIRQRARVELSEHPTGAVMSALGKWLEQFDPKAKGDAHHLLEGLWLHQQFNVKNESLLDQLLNSPEPHARISAGRVKQMWEHNASQPVIASEEKQSDTPPAVQAPADAIVLRTVTEQMRYDQKVISVKAGTRIKIWFENPDFMPHNLIICKPGTATEIATAALALGAKGFELGFVPASEKIIIASKLLNHHEHQLLEFNVPSASGDYEFVCTFPGHAQLMRGIFKVMP